MPTHHRHGRSPRPVYSLRQLAYVAAVLMAAAFVPRVGVMLAAALAIVLVAAETRAPLRDLGLSAPPSGWRTVLAGVAIGLALFLLAKLLITPAIETMTGIRRDLGRLDFLRGDARAYFSFLPLVWLSAGLCEEIVFRSFLIGRIREALGGGRAATAVAVLAASAAFALAHAYQGVTGIVFTGLMALILSSMFVALRFNLWCNVVAHASYDTLSLGTIWLSWDRVLMRWAEALFSR